MHMEQTRIIFLIATLCAIVGIASAALVPSFTVSYLNSSTGNLSVLTSMNATRGQVLYFNGTVSGGTPQQWSWNYGDGYGDLVPNTTHSYTYAHDHVMLFNKGVTKLQVILTVSDATGNYSTTPKVINLSVALPRWGMAPTDSVIPLLNETNANNYLSAIGGNVTLPDGWAGLDWLGVLHTTEQVYVDVLGWTIFLLVVFSVPFMMNWILTKDFVISGILGGFLGIWIIARLPAQFQLMAIAFIGMSIVAVLYSLLKERV